MPWPPTGILDSLTLSDQLASPVTPGVDSEQSEELYEDPYTGTIAPGVGTPLAPEFDALPQPDEGLLKPVEAGAKRQMVIDWASQWVDKVPYVWGGTTPKGFDCSGLLWAAFKHAGISLPRVSYAHAKRGVRMAIDDLSPGDLVAWDTNPRIDGPDHIALYIGNGRILEAAHSGTKVRIRKLGKNEGAWGVHLNY